MLETLKEIQLSNFSSLFEIAATLNLIYVVAERAKQYGSTLTKNFFQSETNIEKKFKERYSLIDRESVETMPAIVVGNGSTEGEIQRAKRDIHKLADSQKMRIDKLKNQTDNRCVLSSFSFISLYMFLYSLFMSFLGGLNVTPFTKAYFSTFTLLSVLVLILVSIYGEKEKPKWITKNLNLTKCCWCFLVLMFVSVVSVSYRITVESYAFIYWPLAILLGVILPYLSFIIFMLIIHNRLIGLSKDLSKELTEYDEECKKVEGRIHQLKEAYELSVNMESNNDKSKEKGQVLIAESEELGLVLK